MEQQGMLGLIVLIKDTELYASFQQQPVQPAVFS